MSLSREGGREGRVKERGPINQENSSLISGERGVDLGPWFDLEERGHDSRTARPLLGKLPLAHQSSRAGLGRMSFRRRETRDKETHEDASP